MEKQNSINELIYLIAFTKLKGISDIDKKKLVIHLGSAQQVFEYCKSKQELHHIYWPLEIAKREIDFISKHAIQSISILDKDYPQKLIHIDDAPLLLYHKGKGNIHLPYLISIVGTRAHTRQSFAIIKDLIEGIKHLPIGIISGLALGIDTIAHKTALEYTLPTWAVLGHGLDMIYPTQNRQLAISILEQGGLFTEFTSKTSPLHFHFPKRNRIVAGLSDATIVVETDTKGGSMITAGLAFKYNREVFAAPGKIYDPKSRGCLALIKNNMASIYHDPIHFLEAMQWPIPEKPKIRKQNQQRSFNWDPISQQIIEFIDIHSPVQEAFIHEHFSMESAQLAAKLLDLELDGAIERQAGNQYARKID
jgi:DNA processing protein